VSILDKHPAPWTMETKRDEGAKAGDVFNANGVHVVLGIESFWDEGAKRLILAAPELLAALKRVEEYGRLDEDARALIARIEGGK
jgi:hypothetical protein